MNLKFFQYMLAIVAVLAIVSADIILKVAAQKGSYWLAMKSPWFWLVIALYLFQICAFLYLFVAGTNLSFIGVLQTELYALFVVGAGIMIFKETFAVQQWIGLALVLIGAFFVHFKL